MNQRSIETEIQLARVEKYAGLIMANLAGESSLGAEYNADKALKWAVALNNRFVDYSNEMKEKLAEQNEESDEHL